MEITLKKLSISRANSDETICFSADVYVNDVKAFVARNRGCGGPNDYHPYAGHGDRPDGEGTRLLKQAEDYAASLPPTVHYGVSLPTNLDAVIDDLITKEQERKTLLRWCRNNLVYRTPDMKPGDYYKCAGVYTKRRADQLREDHPGIEIVNETLGVAVPA